MRLFEELAKQVFPEGADLRCERCRRKRWGSWGACAVWLRTGWPRCCGQTMAVTKRERRRKTVSRRDAEAQRSER